MVNGPEDSNIVDLIYFQKLLAEIDYFPDLEAYLCTKLLEDPTKLELPMLLALLEKLAGLPSQLYYHKLLSTVTTILQQHKSWRNIH